MSDDGKSQQMKPGVYELRIYIEETRTLTMKNPGELNAILKCSVYGQTHKSKVHKNASVLENHWRQNFYFTKKIDSQHEIEDEIVVITIVDSAILGSDPLIGRLEIDLLSIYNQNKNHAIQYQWAGLANDDIDFDSIKGYIKFSANMYTAGDTPVNIGDEPVQPSKGGDKKSSGAVPSNLMMPPQLKTKPFQFNALICCAQKLPKLDLFGKLDSYVCLEFASNQSVIPHIDDNQNPHYNHQILMPYTEPALSALLKICFIDYNEIEADTHFGTCLIHKKDFDQYQSLIWINIYGSEPIQDQIGKESDIQIMMNQDPDMANFWLGRCLLKFQTEAEKHPLHEVKEFLIEAEEEPDEIFKDYIDSNKNKISVNTFKEYKDKLLIKNFWQIIVEVHFGLYFPDLFTKYRLRFCWGEYQLDTQLREPQDKESDLKWLFYERLTVKGYMPYTNTNELELPDIFLYLMNSDSQIVCFYRRPAKEFLNSNSVPISCSFKANHQRFPDINQSSTGSVRFRAYINYESVVQEKIKKNRWTRPLEQTKREPGTLLINLYQANDILASNSSGLSDPYIKFSYNGKGIKSNVLKNTLNPIWDEGMKLKIDYFNDLVQSPFIYIELFDKNLLEKDLLLGFRKLDIHENKNQPVAKKNPKDKDKYELLYYHQQNKSMDYEIEPDWIDLTHSHMPAGKILVSFQFIPDSVKTKIQENISIPLELPSCNYFIKLKIIGLRGLVSAGILPVKKAFLVFDVQSLQKKQKVESEKQLVTLPKVSGSSPNLLTVLSTEVELPIDIAYMPNMQVYCYDSIMGGMSQELIGNFEIDIKSMIQLTKARVEARKIQVQEEEEKKRLLLIQQQKDQQKNQQKNQKNKVQPPQQTQLQAQNPNNQIPQKEEPQNDQNKDPKNDQKQSSAQISQKAQNKSNQNQYIELNESKLKNDSNQKIKLLPQQDSKDDKIVQKDPTKDDKIVQKDPTKDDKIVQKDPTKDDVQQDPQIQKSNNNGRKSNLRVSDKDLDIKNIQVQMNSEKDYVSYKSVTIQDPKQQQQNQQPSQDPKQQQQNQQPSQDPKQQQQNKQPSQDQIQIKNQQPQIDLAIQPNKKKDMPIVIKAQYKQKKSDKKIKVAIFEEINKPDESQYLMIGYDPKQIKKTLDQTKYKKHYRLLLDKSLEETDYIDKHVFQEIQVMHKHSLQPDNFFAQKLHLTQNTPPVRGLFKAWIDIFNEDYKPEYEKYIDQSEDFSYIKAQKVSVRLYIFRVINIVGVDDDGNSSPYLKIKLGDKEIDESSLYIKDVDEFDKYKMYQFVTQVPGDQLIVQLWHHNMIESDKLIGTTYIDLEDRWFSKKWKSAIEHPIETRQLIDDDTSLAMAACTLTCQVYSPENEKKIPLWDISPKPQHEFELRVVIWHTKGVKLVDGDFNDLQIIVHFGEQSQHTDVHWRSQSGDGDFNWRCVFPITYPCQDPIIGFQIMEASLIESDDPIAETEMNIKDMCDYVYENELVMKKEVNGKQKFEIDTILNPSLQNKENEEKEHSLEGAFQKRDNKPESGGKILVSVHLLPKKKALANQQGKARDSPNTDPKLPDPPDRLSLSPNPLTMIDEFIGPTQRHEIMKCLIIIGLIALTCMLVPIIFGNLISTGITSI